MFIKLSEKPRFWPIQTPKRNTEPLHSNNQPKGLYSSNVIYYLIMTKHKYFAQGEQTNLTPLVYNHAERAKRVNINNPRITALSEPLISVYRTCKYISELPIIKGYVQDAKEKSEEEKQNNKLKNSVFRQRDLDQVLREGYLPTCSERGLLFRGLMIAQEIPTMWVETFHEDYILDRRPRKTEIMGHVIGRVFDGDRSYLVDPTPNPRITEDEVDALPHVILAEGLDTWHLGIKTYQDLELTKRACLPELLTRLEKNRRTEFEKRVQEIERARRRPQ